MGDELSINNTTNNNWQMPTDTAGCINYKNIPDNVWLANAEKHDVNSDGVLENAEVTMFLAQMRKELPKEVYEKAFKVYDDYYMYPEYKGEELVSKTFVGKNSNRQTKVYYDENKTPYKVVTQNINAETGQREISEFNLKENTAHWLHDNENTEVLLPETRKNVGSILNSEKRNLFGRIADKVLEFFK